MSVYFISLVLSDSDDSWREEYHKYVPDMIKKYHGEIIATTRSPVVIEGELKNPESATVLRFRSQDDLTQFIESEEYRPFKDARKKTAKTEIVTFDFDDTAMH